MPQHPAVRLLCASAALLALAGCGTDSPTRLDTPAPGATTTPSANTPGSPVPSASAAPPPSVVPQAVPVSDKSFTLSFDGTKTTGDTGRLRVRTGESVTITVQSTATDEVHLHGYDRSAPVSSDVPAVLTFKATIPGVFEVELERLGKQLASLQVQ